MVPLVRFLFVRGWTEMQDWQDLSASYSKSLG